ncbi:hypothetical protein, partial [Corallococcus exiguus]
QPPQGASLVIRKPLENLSLTNRTRVEQRVRPETDFFSSLLAPARFTQWTEQATPQETRNEDQRDERDGG